MNEENQQFEFNINPRAPLFVIGVVSEMVSIPVWTLRKIDELGIVSPKRIGTKTRCYSKQQITQLIHIRYLMKEKRVNISGVKVIIEMNYKKEDQDV
ncbi:MAG: MerR family transcriptional regulator [Candidatus Omnitrophica bacterium]|nr:MerR family transcriptional regulator [Candidatus Omnitrophota bacterium]